MQCQANRRLRGRRERLKIKDVVDVGRAGLIDSAKVIFATEDPAKMNRRIFTEPASVDPNDRLRFCIERTHKLFRDQPNHHEMVRTVLYAPQTGTTIATGRRYFATPSLTRWTFWQRPRSATASIPPRFIYASLRLRVLDNA